jgi:signal transduction histidine kinase/CheY-like chemotaxis protein
MPPFDKDLFETQPAITALEKYSAVTRLSVRIYGRDKRLIAKPIGANRLAELCSTAYEPRIVAECVSRCFSQSEQSASVCLEQEHGLGVVGAPLVYAGQIVYVAIAAYALTSHIDQLQLRRLTSESGLSLETLWVLIGSEAPLTRERLTLNGELLRILGDTLLSEHYRGRQLEEALARLESANHAKDEFLATLSHELRAPLNTIVGWSAMLRAGTLDAATTAQALEIIERDAKVQTRLVNDLLDVSRIVAGKLRLDLQPVDLIPILTTALDWVRSSAVTKGVSLNVQFESTGSVMGDPDRLRQIFFNLLSNAVKFTGPGGGVTLRAQRIASMVQITVNDTGQGIRADFLPHLFERFRQGDSSITKQHTGLGLGLSIAQHLIERHNGTIHAFSEGEGRGATFTVTLPRLERPAIETKEEPFRFRNGKPTELNGVRVWVVDDMVEGRLMLKTLLEQSGAEVTTLASGYEVLNKLDESTPEVLIADIGMPGMDGYTLIRELRGRGSERGGNVPAIAVSGYVTPEDQEHALSSGYQIHLAKPFDANDLIRAVRSLAEPRSHPARAEIGAPSVMLSKKSPEK